MDFISGNWNCAIYLSQWFIFLYLPRLISQPPQLPTQAKKNVTKLKWICCRFGFNKIIMSFGTVHTMTKQKRLANMLWLCECGALCGPFVNERERENYKFGHLVELLVVTGHRYRAISHMHDFLFPFFGPKPMTTSHVMESSRLPRMLTIMGWCFELVFHAPCADVSGSNACAQIVRLMQHPLRYFTIK